MQKIAIEVSHSDQVWIEEQCLKEGLTMSLLVEKAIESYRNPPASKKETLPKRGRKKKVDVEEVVNSEE